METKQIPSYDVEEFRSLVERSPDVLHLHPCVVRGFIDQWPASQRWVDFEYLTTLFGHLPVTAGAPQFTTHKHARMCQVKTDFATYLKYVQDPSSVDVLFEGKWSKGDAQVFRELNLPLYCGNLRIVRHSKEKVFGDLDPLVPAPVEHLNDLIPYFYQCGNHLWLYVSLTGALTPLHEDNNTVFAYLAQLQGRKRAILYDPMDRAHYHNPSVGYLDPLNPNDEEFPTWRQAQPWTAHLNPGELLIWGPNWAHHVVTLENSITASFDFVNFVNLESYARSEDWRHELGLFARRNADLVRARVPDPRVHAALESATEAELGREVMICVLRSTLKSELPERSRRVSERMLGALSVSS